MKLLSFLRCLAAATIAGILAQALQLPLPLAALLGACMTFLVASW